MPLAPLLLPVTVSVEVERGPLFAVLIVSVDARDRLRDARENDPAAPAGNPLTLRYTVSVKVEVGVTVTV